MPSSRRRKKLATPVPSSEAVRVHYAMGALCCPFCGGDILLESITTHQWINDLDSYRGIDLSRRLYCRTGHTLQTFRDGPFVTSREGLTDMLLNAQKRGHPLK